MRSSRLLAALLCAAPAFAQNWYVPDSDPATGNCNVIPFGLNGGVWLNQKYQTRCTAADLGGIANVITGLGFAACTAGRLHYDHLEIVLDHIPPSQPLSTTFAANLTAAAVTVLDAPNYTWNVTANNAWHEIGLQTFFVYNGIDDLVVQITTTNSIAPAGFHRGTRERIYWTGATGPAAATGSTDMAAGKIEVSMLTAKTSSHGDGCLGSNGTPQLGFSGSAQVGNTLSFDLTNGVPSGIALLIAGIGNGFPFPFDLGILGAPGCFAYTDLTTTLPVVLDGSGNGSAPLAIPASAVGFLFYAQYAVLDPAANQFGFTTSNYGRVLTGT